MCQGLLNLTLNNRNYWNVTRNCYYDLLLNMNLISNLGKFRAIRLWVWPSKASFTTIALAGKEFQRRFQNTFDFNHSFFPGSFQNMGKQYRQGMCSNHLSLCLTLSFVFGYCSRECLDLKINVYIFCWHLLVTWA